MAANGRAHTTHKYELMMEEKALVLRRGSAFTIVVTFTHENFSPKEDNMKLVFHTGKYYNDGPMYLWHLLC